VSAAEGLIAGQLRALSPAHRALWVLATGHGFVLLGSVWMIVPKLLQGLAFPIDDPWLPWPLRSAVVYGLAVLGPALFGAYAAARPGPGALRVWAWWCFAGGAVGLVHQMTLGWAEVLLMFWTGAWGLWLGYARDCVVRGPRLALVLIGLLFAYPAIGKFTPAYWSGEQFWLMHWRHGAGLPGLMVTMLGEAAVRPWVRVYGPLSILAESALALVWLLPRRVGFAAVFVGAAGILAGGGWGFMGAMGLVASTAASALALANADRIDRWLAGTAG
jgi:hypothetical protein